MTKRFAMVLGLLVLAGVLIAASAQAGHKTVKVTNVNIAGWSSGPDEDKLVQQMVDTYNASHKSVHFNTKKFYPKLLNAFKHGKTIYGFPKDWGPLAEETSNALLGQAGVKAPKTWAQLKSVAKTIRSKGVAKHPICLSPDWARMGAFMYQNKGSITKHLTSTANAKAVKYYVGLINSGLAYTPPAGSWCGQELGQNHAAIAFEGPWIFPYMKQVYPNTHYGIRPMPKGKTQGNLAFTVSWSLAKDSQNKSAAWQVLSWLTGKQGEKIWMSKGLSLSPRTDVATIGGRKAFTSAAPYSHGWGFGNPNFAKANGVMNNDLSSVIDGKMTIHAMLVDVSKALKGQ
jgi:multiple sugar transport system substrate-binding protein